MFDRALRWSFVLFAIASMQCVVRTDGAVVHLSLHSRAASDIVSRSRWTLRDVQIAFLPCPGETIGASAHFEWGVARAHSAFEYGSYAIASLAMEDELALEIEMQPGRYCDVRVSARAGSIEEADPSILRTEIELVREWPARIVDGNGQPVPLEVGESCLAPRLEGTFDAAVMKSGAVQQTELEQFRTLLRVIESFEVKIVSQCGESRAAP